TRKAVSKQDIAKLRRLALRMNLFMYVLLSEADYLGSLCDFCIMEHVQDDVVLNPSRLCSRMIMLALIALSEERTARIFDSIALVAPAPLTLREGRRHHRNWRVIRT
ncbi:MAG: hypothetical protein ACJ8G2_12190, partial [Burkholderiales bacterium]